MTGTCYACGSPTSPSKRFPDVPRLVCEGCVPLASHLNWLERWADRKWIPTPQAAALRSRLMAVANRIPPQNVSRRDGGGRFLSTGGA